jgi:hypothetical protein
LFLVPNHFCTCKFVIPVSISAIHFCASHFIKYHVATNSTQSPIYAASPDRNWSSFKDLPDLKFDKTRRRHDWHCSFIISCVLQSESDYGRPVLYPTHFSNLRCLFFSFRESKSFSDVYLPESLCRDCRWRHMSVFRCFDGFPSNSRCRFWRMAFLRA